MREQNIAYISLFVAIGLCSVGLSLETPGMNNPVGSATVPPTMYKSGLIPSANPIDTSGNMVITGNVAGGMYFRGVVPYSSPTNFSAPASSLTHTSGAFDTFLRDSASSQNFEQRSGGTTPYYYSPTQTVTTTIPGTGGQVTTPAVGSYNLSMNAPQVQTGYYQRGYVPQATNRPLSMSQQELEKLIEADIANNPVGVLPVTELQSQNQFWQQMRIPMEQRMAPPQASQEGIPPGTEPNVATLLGLSAKLVKPPSMELVGPNQVSGQEQTTQELFNPLRPSKELDIYEQMKLKIGSIAVDMNLPAEIAKGKGTIPKEANAPSAGTGAGMSLMGAKTVTEAYKSFAAYSDDKFNRHIRAAENYMKQGRFYRAADAYTLATIYKPNDPLGYAGKSQAMFAAGEYMSSALFLARALEIFPGYAKFKIDLVGMVGDKDTMENRILEAREWLDRSQSPELAFLLSYVYYQMDRLDFAKKAIEWAAQKMPDSPAVAALKKAIDERIANM